MTSEEVVLSVEKLAKTYKTINKRPGFFGGIESLINRQSYKIHAVRPLDFSVKKGEFVGLLGPNGAGKTTTLKMLTGLIPPTSGRADAFGRFNTSQRPIDYLKQIGMVMGQRNQLNPDLPALDSFKLSQAIYQISDQDFQERLDTYLNLFDARDKLLTPIRKLSLGERMKMELILSILHQPKLLFLDEPTIGLDFVAAKQIRNFLKEINQSQKITIILTSHYVKDIQELCRRVIINQGRCVFDGALEQMDIRIRGQREINLVVKDEHSKIALKESLNKSGSLKESIELLPEKDQRSKNFNIAVNKNHCPAVLELILHTIEPDKIVDIKISERPLEDIFSEIYAGTSQ